MSGVFLNVGCGDRLLDRFLNLDLEGAADIELDVTQGLPFPDGSVRGIYSEHFIEHVSQRDALRFFRECRRVLEPGGRIRIATPDLEELARNYTNDDRDQAMLERFGFDWVANRCELFNVSMRFWGHQWLYDETELRRLGEEAGLVFHRRCGMGESEWTELSGLEWRDESHLILEFEAPTAEATAGQPRVTVAIPAYNPRYYAESLRSVLLQDLPDMEVLVCDDSMGEEIARWTAEVAEDDPRVRLIRNETNLGDRGNYLACFERARGRYFKIMNDDDVLAPGAVARMAAILDEHPDVRLVTSYRRRIDADGNVLPDETVTRPLVGEDSLVEGLSLAQHLMQRQINAVGEPSCALFRRDDLARLTPDFMSFAGRRSDYNVDMGMWLSLLSRGDAVYLADPLCSFRIHDEQAQQTDDARERGLAAWALHTEDAVRWGMLDRERHGPLRTIPLGDVEAHRARGGWGRRLHADRLTRDLYDPSRHRPACDRFEQGDHAGAIVAVQEELNDYPTAPLLWSDLGAMRFASGDTAGAEAAVRQALAIDPAHPGALLNMASLARDAGDADGCIRCLLAVSGGIRSGVDDLVEAAEQLESLGQSVEALKAVERILERDAHHAWARSTMDRWCRTMNVGVTS